MNCKYKNYILKPDGKNKSWENQQDIVEAKIPNINNNIFTNNEKSPLKTIESSDIFTPNYQPTENESELFEDISPSKKGIGTGALLLPKSLTNKQKSFNEETTINPPLIYYDVLE